MILGAVLGVVLALLALSNAETSGESLFVWAIVILAALVGWITATMADLAAGRV
jgi:hypothetical protein